MRATDPALVASTEERQIIERLSKDGVIDLARVEQVVRTLASAEAREHRQSLDLRDRAGVEENLRRLLIGNAPHDLAPAVRETWDRFAAEWASEASCLRLHEQLSAVDAATEEREKARQKSERDVQTNRDRIEALKRLADVLDLLAGLPPPSPHENRP